MLNEIAARSRALSAQQPGRLDRPPAAYQPLDIPVGRQEPQAVEGVENVAQGPVVDAVVDFHKSGGQPEPADPQQHPGGVQQVLRAGALSPPEELQESSHQLCESHLTWDSPGYPRSLLAVVGHSKLPPVDTIIPPVPHGQSTRLFALPGTEREVWHQMYRRMAVTTRLYKNPRCSDKHTGEDWARYRHRLQPGW